MSSEWMKVMLEEISRKKAEAEQSRAEEQKRSDEARARGEPRGRDEPRARDGAIGPRSGAAPL
jgi:hypothetical protein